LVGKHNALQGLRAVLLGKDLDHDDAVRCQERTGVQGQEGLGPKVLVLGRGDIDDVKDVIISPAAAALGNKAEGVVVYDTSAVGQPCTVEVLADYPNSLGGFFHKHSFPGPTAQSFDAYAPSAREQVQEATPRQAPAQDVEEGFLDSIGDRASTLAGH
jgi:hypothetical protein